jgi:hypothetical protein
MSKNTSMLLVALWLCLAFFVLGDPGDTVVSLGIILVVSFQKFLLQFHVHAEISNVKAHVVTNTHVVQLPMLTQRHQSVYLVAKFPAPKLSAPIHVLPWVGSVWN